MKLGTENRNKTIFALVLCVLALIFVAKWLLTSGTSTAKIALPRPVAATEPANGREAHANPKHSASQRSDQKTIATTWKPSLDPRLELKSLQSSEAIEYKGSGRNIFEMTAEPAPVIPQPIAPARKDANAAQAPSPVYVPPAPLPINLKFYGFATKTGSQKSIFLSQDGSVFVAKEGDIIARRYKVVRINASSVEILDMLSNNKQTIALTAG
jgi:hypothetical protein